MLFQFLKITYLKSLQYRAAHIISIVTQIFWGLMSVFIAVLFFQGGTNGNIALSMTSTVSYLWLGRLVSSMCSPFPTIGMSQMILDGSIAFDLIRPISSYYYFFIRILAQRLAGSIFTTPFIAIIALLMPDPYKLYLPQSYTSAALFILSLFLSVILISAFELCMETGTFFSASFHGIARVTGQLFVLVSGNTIPLDFFPSFAKSFVKALPFASVIDTPFLIYLSSTVDSELFSLICLQIIWCLFFIILGSVLLNLAIKKLEIAGG